MNQTAVPSDLQDAYRSFSSQLVAWQRRCGRHDLPWQNTRDAYRVWLSEIMLQQTQVGTATPYYLRFLERFPNVGALAAAPVGAVLEAWAGLGYYARARNLHRCAQRVLSEFGGKFPAEPTQLAGLPGIGRSTAAAIAVFAYGARAAILDGNVKRVLTRCFGVDGFPGRAAVERSLWQLAEALLPEQELAPYTQGLMDLGATLCTRAAPACAACPLAAQCVARREGRQSELPAPRPPRVVPEREVSVLLLHDGAHVLLERRPPAGIWGGLLALPEVARADAADFARLHACRLLETRELPPLRHAFSHFRLLIRPYLCRVEACSNATGEPGWEWLPTAAFASAALPAPVRRILSRHAGVNAADGTDAKERPSDGAQARLALSVGDEASMP